MRQIGSVEIPQEAFIGGFKAQRLNLFFSCRHILNAFV